MRDQTIISMVIKQGVMSNVATLFWETILQRFKLVCVSVVDRMQTRRVHSDESLLLFTHGTVILKAPGISYQT